MLRVPRPRSLLAATRSVAGLIVATVAVAACDGDAPSAELPRAGGTDAEPPVPVAPADVRDYRFRWLGADDDLPWNRTLYLRPDADGGPGSTAGLVFFPEEASAIARGRPGTTWEVCSEAVVTRPMQRVLWTWSATGRFGDEEWIDLSAPPRPHVVLTGTEGVEAGTDTITVVDESSSARLAAVRDPLKGLSFASWDARQAPGPDVWAGTTLIAPPRPWRWSEVREGKFAIAARAEGRQWIARRVTLAAGATETFDVAAQPPGGGTVISEDGSAELLLFGDVPVAPVRVVRDLLRARWDGVPPGSHVVRSIHGQTTKVDVADGATVTVPRTAR